MSIRELGDSRSADLSDTEESWERMVAKTQDDNQKNFRRETERFIVFFAFN